MLVASARAAHPAEAGGVLLGVTARRTLWITVAVELPGDSGSGHYLVPEGATVPAVKQARSTDPRLGYLGEWHSHTKDTGASFDDRATMRAISWFVRRPPPGGPLLIVVRRRGAQYALSGYKARFPLLRPVRLVLTGPLPVQP